MSEWAQKRFWKDVAVSEMNDGYSIKLDGRVVKTPLKRTMSVPTEKLAAAIAGEWDAQDGVVDPTTMPFTRSANAAIDKVADQRNEVAALISAYGETDLLCYFAEGPDALIERQEAGWRPYLGLGGIGAGRPPENRCRCDACSAIGGGNRTAERGGARPADIFPDGVSRHGCADGFAGSWSFGGAWPFITRGNLGNFANR